ncbi:3'-5' exonuclease [Oscillibacter sp.]|uniref:3'-5' exonuclease n=1 Tax=Oscillibacter sp. TaxID=1945593 RepID=UPI00257C4C69|nr:3'-5' exonuclease [Oscillibacter sp.]
MDDGAARRENLIALSQHAEKFESNGYRGLFAFVTQLRRLLEQDQAPATRGPAEAAGVRLMSIHKSKGLEFPIVILADLDHAFSRQDFDTPVLVHPDMGLGPKRIDLERKIQYPTLARLAIQEKLRRENLAEEQRILYVASDPAQGEADPGGRPVQRPRAAPEAGRCGCLSRAAGDGGRGPHPGGLGPAAPAVPAGGRAPAGYGRDRD